MPYRLKSSESLPKGIRRIAREEIESAERLLRHTTAANREEAIHEARKSIKKARALLRLIRPQLDGSREDDRLLREIGHKLSAYRDAQAIIEMFDNLNRKFKNTLKSAAVSSIRRALLQRKEERERNIHIVRTLKKRADSLRAVAKRVDAWKFRRNFGLIAAALASTYSRSRRRWLAFTRKCVPSCVTSGGSS